MSEKTVAEARKNIAESLEWFTASRPEAAEIVSREIEILCRAIVTESLAPQPKAGSQEQPAASGPGKPSGGAPSDDDLEEIGRNAWDKVGGADVHEANRYERRALFEAGAASRDAEIAAYRDFVSFVRIQHRGGITKRELEALDRRLRELAALEAKEAGKA